MNNDVAAPMPGAEEVEPVASATTPAHGAPIAGVTDKAPASPAGRSVAGELHKVFYWLAMR